jgi:hypothetical protein
MSSTSTPQPEWICPHCLSQVVQTNRHSWGVLLLAGFVGVGALGLYRSERLGWAIATGLLSLLLALISLVSGRPYCTVCQADGIIPLSTPRGRQLQALSHLDPGASALEREPRGFPSTKIKSLGTH